MKIEYDKTARALYITVRKGKVKRTIKLKDSLLVDLDKGGEVLGIEMLEPAGVFGKAKGGWQIPVSVR